MREFNEFSIRSVPDAVSGMIGGTGDGTAASIKKLYLRSNPVADPFIALRTRNFERYNSVYKPKPIETPSLTLSTEGLLQDPFRITTKLRIWMTTSPLQIVAGVYLMTRGVPNPTAEEFFGGVLGAFLYLSGGVGFTVGVVKGVEVLSQKISLACRERH